VNLAALLLSLMVSPHAALQPYPEVPPGVVVAPIERPAGPSAFSYTLYSVDGDTFLWEKDADRQRPMASTTKIMTAILTAERNNDPGIVVPISSRAATTPIGYVGQNKLEVGDTWMVEELLYDLLVQSDNGAGVALAEYIAGSVESFVELMNQRAAELGMENTAFANPHGLDASGHYSSARDLARMGTAAIDNARITRATRIKYITFDPVQRAPFSVRNTNRLLGTFPGIFGLKTGDTANAGLTFVAFLDTGTHRFIATVMGADDHMAAVARLMGYALDVFRPSDYVLAPIASADVTASFPEALTQRVAAVTPLPTGADRTSPTGSTPAERALITAFDRLLPGVLGARR
jgi:D-alanyl-D-alanine carboxypeptidase